MLKYAFLKKDENELKSVMFAVLYYDFISLLLRLEKARQLVSVRCITFESVSRAVVNLYPYHSIG